jgi:micrococcal nuclease
METAMVSSAIPNSSLRILAGLLLTAALAASAPLGRTEPPPPGALPRALPQAALPGAARQMIPAELIRVIDGDTLEMRALIWLDQQVVTRVRLRGIDAPEAGSRCPEESRRAAAAAAALQDLLASRRLHLTDIGRDKYGGRVLARVIAGASADVGEAMLAAGHARPYAGGRRERRCA